MKILYFKFMSVSLYSYSNLTFSELRCEQYCLLFRGIQNYSILIGSLPYNKSLIVRFVIFLIYCSVHLFHIVGLGIN